MLVLSLVRTCRNASLQPSADSRSAAHLVLQATRPGLGWMCSEHQAQCSKALCATHARWWMGAGRGGRAGKTSLLCALAGKVYYGTVTGRVFVNGCVDRLDRYKRVRDPPHHAGTASAAALQNVAKWDGRADYPSQVYTSWMWPASLVGQPCQMERCWPAG